MNWELVGYQFGTMWSYWWQHGWCYLSSKELLTCMRGLWENIYVNMWQRGNTSGSITILQRTTSKNHKTKSHPLEPRPRRNSSILLFRRKWVHQIDSTFFFFILSNFTQLWLCGKQGDQEAYWIEKDSAEKWIFNHQRHHYLYEGKKNTIFPHCICINIHHL